MDVVAEVDGLRIVLEAETGFHRKAQAIKDADARLRQGLTTAVFAVCYPDGVTEHNLADAELTWTLRLKPGEPQGEWSTGGLNQLAQAVLQAPGSLSGADIAAQWLSDGLDQAVQRMAHPVRQAMAQALDLPATRPQSKQQGDGYFVAASAGCWLWRLPCCSTTASSSTCRLNGRMAMTASGRRPAPQPARSRMELSVPSGRRGAASSPWTTGRFSRPEGRQWVRCPWTRTQVKR